MIQRELNSFLSKVVQIKTEPNLAKTTGKLILTEVNSTAWVLMIQRELNSFLSKVVQIKTASYWDLMKGQRKVSLTEMM